MSLGNPHVAAESEICALREGSAALPLGVCHIASGDRWAGAEVQIASLLRCLAKDPRLQLSAVLLNHGRLADEIASLGVALRVIPESEKGLRAIIQETCNFLVDRNVAVIHSHRYKENLIAVWAARRCGVPHLVRTQHGMPEPLGGYRALKQGIIRLMDRLIARRATDRVISVSDEMSSHLARSLQESKIITIPNGIDPELVQSKFTSEEAKIRLGIPPHCLVIGTAGRLERIKRLDIFIRAAAVIAFDPPSHLGAAEDASAGQSADPNPGKKIPLKPSKTKVETSPEGHVTPSTAPTLDESQIRYVIAGEGREAGSLAAFAQSMGLGNRILFLGHRDDIHDVLRAFDVLVLSSDHEGLPMVLLEALAQGIPVVARAVGGIPEAIQHGVNGLMVDSSDPRSLATACLKVLADCAGSRRLGHSGLEFVRTHFSAAKNAQRVAQLYLSLCRRS